MATLIERTGDPYELSKLLGHSNIKMAERSLTCKSAHRKDRQRLKGAMEQDGTTIRKGEIEVAQEKIGHRA